MNFCKIDVVETGNVDCPYKFEVNLDGELVNKLSLAYKVIETKNEITGQIEKTRKNQLQEAFDWLHCIKTNIAVQNGVFPARKLVENGIPNLFASKDL